jgi:hypothetical protein
MAGMKLTIRVRDWITYTKKSVEKRVSAREDADNNIQYICKLIFFHDSSQFMLTNYSRQSFPSVGNRGRTVEVRVLDYP